MGKWTQEVIESVVSQVRERWEYAETTLVCIRFERENVVGIISKGLYDPNGGLNIFGNKWVYTISWLVLPVTDASWESFECSGDFHEYGEYEEYMADTELMKAEHPEWVWVDIEGA